MNEKTETTTTNSPESKIAADAATIGTKTATTAAPESTIDRMAKMAFSKPDENQREAPTTNVAGNESKATTVAEIADEVPAEIKSDKARANWKELRTKAKERDELETKYKSASEELERLKSAPKSEINQSEIEQLRKEREQYSEELRKANLERHPRFKSYFESKTNAAIEQAKKAVGSEHAENVAALLKLPEGQHKQEQIEQVMQGLTLLQQNQLANAVSKLDEANSERDAELSKWRENSEELSRVEKAEQEKQSVAHKQKVQSILSNALNSAKEMEAFKTREGDDDHNNSIPVREEFIKAAFEGRLTEQQFYGLPLIAAEGMFLKEKELPKLRNQVAELEKELASLKSAKPSLNGGESSTAAIPENASVIDRIAAQARNSGATR